MQQYIYILGINSKGKRFRPSDWAERICDLLASYGGCDGNTRFHRYAIPAVYENEKAIRLNPKLMNSYPQFWKFVIGFSKDNDLKIIDNAGVV